MRVRLNDEFNDALNRIVACDMVKWDGATDIIFVVNRFKLIPNNLSPKVLRGAINELNLIKHPFKKDFIELYKDKFITPDCNYLSILQDYKENADLLNKEQARSFAKLGWHKERIKKFYIDRQYPEQRIDEIINEALPHLGR